MKTHTIMSAVVSVATCMSVFAATPAKTSAPVTAVAPIVPVEKKLSAYVSAGYASNYSFRNIVAGGIEDSVGVLGAGAKYQINTKSAILADYRSVLLDGNDTDIQDEQRFNLGYQNTSWIPKTSVTMGYNFIHGGLTGLLAHNAGFTHAPSGHAHSIVQEFYTGTVTEFGKGFDWQNKLSYAFSGLTGWWYNTEIGWTKNICSKTSVRVYAGLNAADSYWSKVMNDMTGGWQSFYLGANLPMEVAKKLSIVPFVNLTWAGNGPMKINDGERNVKPFATIAGFNVVYTF